MTKLRTILLSSTVVVSVLSGCSDDTPKVTDADILSMMGKPVWVYDVDKTHFGEHGIPLVIDHKVDECVRLLSGLEVEKLQDAPADWMGMLKTGCREDLLSIINDTDRNRFQFKLSHFENPDFANRISRIMMEAKKSAKTAIDEARLVQQAAAVAAKEADRLKQQAEIDTAKEKLNALQESFPALVKELFDVCHEYKLVRQKFKLRDPGLANTSKYIKPAICYSGYEKQYQFELNSVAEKLQKLKPKTNRYSFFNVPVLPDLKAKMLVVHQRIAEMKEMNAKPLSNSQ